MYQTRLATKSTYYKHSLETNYDTFSIRYTGPTIWNNLNESTKSLFLKLLKQILRLTFYTHMLNIALYLSAANRSVHSSRQTIRYHPVAFQSLLKRSSSALLRL